MRLGEGDDALLARLLAEEGAAAPRAAEIPRRAPGAEAPLSFGQRRLWFLDRLAPGSPAYVIAAAFRLLGPLDLARFGRSLQAVAGRHDVLRSVFFAGTDGEPRQRAIPPGEFAFAPDFADLSGEADPRAAARRIAAEEAERPFELERGPPMRVRLLRLAPQEHAVICALHHIVSDGWSTGIFIRELGARYRGEAEPAPLPVQYADFAAWQRAPENAVRAEASLAWWRERLRGLPDLELPADRPRPAIWSFGAHRLRLATDARTRAGLAELARREGTTLFAVVLAAYQAALAGWSGQRDFAVGSPVAGRTRAELEALIGFFVNTLVLRSDLGGDPTFAELARRARGAVQEALARQDAPFERLVEELNPGRHLSQGPLVQAALAFENAGTGRLELSGLTLEPIEPEAGVAKFDLTLSLADAAEGLKGTLDASSDLFSAASAEAFARRLERVLAAAAAEPGRRLSALLAPDTMETERLRGWERGPDLPARPWQSVPGRVAERAGTAPEAPALRGRGARLSYGEFALRARRLARALRSRGVGPEALVAVCLPRSAGQAVAQWATWIAGGAFLSLDPSHPPERLRALAEAAGARAVVAEPGIFEGGSAPVLGAEAEGEALGEPWREPAPERLAYVIFTSGSTGMPKGVAVSHGALANLVRWHEQAFGLGPSDVATGLAGPGFDASIWEMWPALATGGCLCLASGTETAEPRALQGWLDETGATVSFVPTPMAELLLDLPWTKPGRLRWLLTGGDRLRRRPPAGLPFALSNNYGPTEHAVVATSGMVAPEGAEAPDLGRPIARTRLQVLGPDLSPVPPGAVGEVFLSGPGLARGYLGRPDLTAEAFLPDPRAASAGERMYRTGDLGRWRPDGTLEFRGRADRQVKVRGVRIEPGEVEAALLALPEIRAAAVGLRAVAGEPALVAWVVPAGAFDEPSLRAALRRRLPEAMVPAHWVALEALPLTSSGKVDRRSLPDPRLEGEAGGAPPGTPLEETIARVWGDVLGRAGVAADRSFFDLGGHSLLLLRVQARLQAELGRALPLLDLFSHPTVRSLAAHLESPSAAAADAGVAEAARRGRLQREARERRRQGSLGRDLP
ncbi:MAG TPA: amino acid adenylation domain-containing protein [Opitutaceae bacterium]|nr:amino acid adenylation domain-containing protein [Opitutaceae bacterium]